MTPKRFILFVFLLAGIAAWAQQDDKVIFAVKLNNKWGYMKPNGEYLVAPKYDDAERFYNGFASVKLSNKWGAIDTTGRLAVKFQYDWVLSFGPYGWAQVCIREKFGYIDKTGNLVIPAKYDLNSVFKYGFARVNVGGKYGYIDTTGKIIIALQFCNADLFQENGLARVKVCYEIDRKNTSKYEYNYVDEDITEVSGEQYDSTKYGFINRMGKYVINPQFDDALCFSDGLASVKVKNKWGYIDTTGNYMIKPQFDDAWSFTKGLAIVMINDKWGFIDLTGKFVIVPKFQSANVFS